jgi:CRISPR-associated protein Csh1
VLQHSRACLCLERRKQKNNPIMIDEIINFEKTRKASGENHRSSPQIGLNILFSVEEDRPVVKWGIFSDREIEPENPSPDTSRFEKVGLASSTLPYTFLFSTEHFEKCSMLYHYSTGLISNKRYERKNESCSPFSYIIKLQYIEDLVTDADWDRFVENYKTRSSQFFDVKKDDHLAEEFEQFIAFLKDDENGFLFLKDKIIELAASNEKNVKVKKSDRVLVFFDGKEEYYQQAQANCLEAKSTLGENEAPNMDRTNEEMRFQESDWLCGFSDRKEFLQHKTAIFNKGYKIPSEHKAIINSFFTDLKAKDIFPKPLPIFIDKEELNRKAISIFNKNKKKKPTFADIFEEIYLADEGHDDTDLNNYYLLYAQTEKKKLVVKDFDFVPSFIYRTDYKLESVFAENNNMQSIANIFDFQRTIVRELFDNCLFRKDEKKNVYTNNYWGAVEAKFCKTYNNYRLILQYRKAFYDFIYKSRKQSITGNILKDIVLSSVMDTLGDEKYRVENRAKEERIKTLLDIYFSLNGYFDKENDNFNKITISMAKKTKELLDSARALVTSEEIHLEENNDMEFASVSGN